MSNLRMPLAAVAAAALAVALVSPAQAQMGPPPKLTTQPLKGGAYVIKGDAANTGFVVGTDGVVVVDTQRSVAAARDQIAEIAKVTGKPVKAVIVTHGDPDHVGGLPAYGPNVAIIAHENIRAQILATAREPDGASPFMPAYRNLAANFLPTHTVSYTETNRLAGVETRLIHVAPGHSSGDLIAFFPRQRVVFVGDLLTERESTFPILHVGGSSAGWLQNMRAVLAVPADSFVSGHGGVMNRAELTALVEQVAQRREQIKAMVYQNKTLAEVNAALPEAKASPMFLTFNETTYYELARGYPTAQPPWISMKPNDPRKIVDPAQ